MNMGKQNYKLCLSHTSMAVLFKLHVTVLFSLSTKYETTPIMKQFIKKISKVVQYCSVSHYHEALKWSGWVRFSQGFKVQY